METIIQLEINLVRTEKDLKLVNKHLEWMDELGEVKYLNSLSLADGVMKAKSQAFDLIEQIRKINNTIDKLSVGAPLIEIDRGLNPIRMKDLEHECVYDQYVSQGAEDEHGEYVLTMKCKCGKEDEFQMNVFGSMDDQIEAEDFHNECGDR